MPNNSGNNSTNNENKFPDKGNFSASQNGFGDLKNIATNVAHSNGQNSADKKITDNPTGLDAVKKEVAKKSLEGAATAASGEVGRQAAKALMNSKLGNKMLNTAVNKTKNPFRRFANFLDERASASSEQDKDNVENQEVENDSFDETMEESDNPVISKKVGPILAIGSMGCFGSLLFYVIIVALMLAPILYIDEILNTVKEGATNFWGGIVSFFKGCSNEKECQEKEQDSFYETLLEVHKHYEEKYKIKLNTELITATLTYYDPMAAMNDLNDNDTFEVTNMVDFKKSKAKIKVLADKMKGNGKRCVDTFGNVLIEYKENEIDTECPKSSYANAVVKEEEFYYVDEEKYKNYLEDEFIRKFYFENKNTPEVNEQIKRVINEIYSRVEAVKYLNSSNNSSINFVANNSNVVITDCTGNIELETVSLYEYLQGVLYLEGDANNRSEEYLKAQAIISKNYLYAVNGATPDSVPTTLRIRNCKMNQVYCSVENGCHKMDDGTDNMNTVATGPNSSGTYYRPPVTDVSTLQRIKNAVDLTLSEFIIKDNTFVVTNFQDECLDVCDVTTNILDQKVANEMINSGSSYKDVLLYFYNGEIKEIDMGFAGYPLDIVYNNVTSAYGWRVHPIKKICRTHGGTDIGAPADANIYAISSGVVVSNYYHGSYGNVTILGHGTNTNGTYEYYSLYAHQIRLSTHVSVGMQVRAGQVIGNVGSTGDSTGNHLHIEIYNLVNGKKVKQDPVTYFKGVELTGQVGGALYESEKDCLRCLNSYGAGSC